MQLRYLIGCSSLNSAEPQQGWQMYHQLENYRAEENLQTRPVDAFLCPAAKPSSPANSSEITKAPKLLKTYLAIGARICSAPAWDREFGTIDFLTLMDLRSITNSARNRFLAPLTQ
jgi:putative hemolysin